MMTIIIIRVFFVLLSTLVGTQMGFLVTPDSNFGPVLGGAIGSLGAVILIILEMGLKRVSVSGLSTAVFGLIFGLLIAKLLTSAFLMHPRLQEEPLRSIIQICFYLIFGYLGMAITLRGRDEFNVIIPYVKFSRQDQQESLLILDTSAIIDGRIADLCQTKFVEGQLIVPRFVLKELQGVADSSDTIKRNRGRRGLDILNKIQKDASINVKIHEEEFPDIPTVDAKLVKLAQMLNAKVLTNDYNLNRVAEIQKVTALNINELANALKPVVLPGEALEIKVVKEGKEYNQGIAYLEDGTMVVVENGRQCIGRTARVLVSSVLQTQAGRMIFARLENDKQQ
jgi:uncharacterized protein YacL